MDDVYEVRRRKLGQVLDQIKQVDLARMLDDVRPGKPALNPNYISRLKSTRKGRKRISAEMARDIERALKKPPGWLSDSSPEPKPLKGRSPGEGVYWPLSVPISVYESLSPRTQHDIDEAFTKLVMGAQAQELLAKTKKQTG